ncbi:hypothetical protein I79_011317 [Cricetulus griseus]|uniref:Uncharacterized protein n=1 Tax=Cricetulus griseus TaxID=10029 RepID=G3HKT7_CRIGR|nr:hypothetical protein I79_011317 [Cricetulus griseus]
MLQQQRAAPDYNSQEPARAPGHCGKLRCRAAAETWKAGPVLAGSRGGECRPVEELRLKSGDAEDIVELRKTQGSL